MATSSIPRFAGFSILKTLAIVECPYNIHVYEHVLCLFYVWRKHCSRLKLNLGSMIDDRDVKVLPWSPHLFLPFHSPR